MAEVKFTQYEAYKQLYGALAHPSEKTLKEQLTSLGSWFSVKPACNYYMLLCRERNDYTVLHFNNMNYLKGMQEVKEILESRGTIYDISYNSTVDAYECWIKDKDDEFAMYMFFAYDWGVVEVE